MVWRCEGAGEDFLSWIYLRRQGVFAWSQHPGGTKRGVDPVAGVFSFGGVSDRSCETQDAFPEGSAADEQRHHKTSVEAWFWYRLRNVEGRGTGSAYQDIAITLVKGAEDAFSTAAAQ